jgi:hypothetical protein
MDWIHLAQDRPEILRWKDNIKVAHREIELDGMNWIDLA